MRQNKILHLFIHLGSVVFGGAFYIALELLWRGHSHWTMFFLGGICFVGVGLLNEILPWSTPLPIQMLLGGAVITMSEFLVGVVVNLWLGWAVWDYTGVPGNIMGQVCLPYSGLWVLLSGAIIIVEDYIDYWCGIGEKPRYCVFCKKG